MRRIKAGLLKICFIPFGEVVEPLTLRVLKPINKLELFTNISLVTPLQAFLFISDNKKETNKKIQIWHLGVGKFNLFGNKKCSVLK